MDFMKELDSDRESLLDATITPEFDKWKNSFLYTVFRAVFFLCFGTNPNSTSGSRRFTIYSSAIVAFLWLSILSYVCGTLLTLYVAKVDLDKVSIVFFLILQTGGAISYTVQRKFWKNTPKRRLNELFHHVHANLLAWFFGSLAALCILVVRDVLFQAQLQAVLNKMSVSFQVLMNVNRVALIVGRYLGVLATAITCYAFHLAMLDLNGQTEMWMKEIGSIECEETSSPAEYNEKLQEALTKYGKIQKTMDRRYMHIFLWMKAQLVILALLLACGIAIVIISFLDPRDPWIPGVEIPLLMVELATMFSPMYSASLTARKCRKLLDKMDQQTWQPGTLFRNRQCFELFYKFASRRNAGIKLLGFTVTPNIAILSGLSTILGIARIVFSGNSISVI